VKGASRKSLLTNAFGIKSWVLRDAVASYIAAELALENPKAVPPPTCRRIDIHAHFLPDTYRDALQQAGLAQPDGIAGLPEWDTNTAISRMDNLDFATAILSISCPDVHLGDSDQADTLARTVTQAGARIVDDHPDTGSVFPPAFPYPTSRQQSTKRPTPWTPSTHRPTKTLATTPQWRESTTVRYL
jgi:hypothetical protein